MTNSPTPDSDPNRESISPARRRFRRLRRIALPAGLGLLAGLGGAAWWGWIFVNEQLAPLVAGSLTKTLNRPVNVGGVERFSLNSLRLGASSLPATATDPDRATVEAIEVGFNPLQALLTRKLKLDITLVKPDVYLEQEKQGWVATKIREEEEEGFVELETIRVRDGNAVLLPLGTVKGKRSPLMLSPINGKVDFFDKNKRFAYELTGKTTTGGDVQLAGETRLPSQDTNLNIRAKNLLVADIDRLINLPFDLPTGRGSGNISVQLRPNILQPPINGTAQFEGATLTIPRLPQSFTQAKGGLRFRGTEIRLEDVNALYGKVPLVANGTVIQDTGFNISAKVKPVNLPDVLKTLNVTLPFVVAGQVQADLKLTGPTAKPVLSGVARSTKAGKIDRVDLSRYTAAFKLDTAAEEVVIQGVQATPTAGGQVTGSGRIDLGATDAAGKLRTNIALNFLATNVPGDAIARVYSDGNPLPVDIRRVDAQAQISGPADNVRTFVRWRAPEATYPGSGEILVANGVTTLRNTLFSIAGGTVGAEAVAANGRWRAVITGAGIPLKQFSADLRGLFSGKFNASGSLSSFKPADIRVQGDARFSEGISLLKRPLTAQVQWNGRQILVQQATATGFSANGAIAARLEGTPAITGLDLNVRLSDYNLQDFGIAAPNNIQYSGRTDFVGRITGAPTAPTVTGDVALRRFILNGVAFEPLLRGPLRYAPQGTALDLRGSRDRIAATLDSRNRPIAFEVRRGDALARGRTEGGLLLTEVSNFPLALAKVAGLPPQFAPGGTLTGNLAINLDLGTAVGDLAIARPSLGFYRADQFGGRISFANGTATLSGAELRRGNTILQINGTATQLGFNPQVRGQINVVKGDIQDVLGFLQFFDLQDFGRGLNAPTYGSADTLQTAPVDLANVPIQEQLRRLSEVETLLAQRKAQRASAPIPELRELQGKFAGNIDFGGSLRSGLKATFDLRGQDFQWGRFKAAQVVAVGSFENGSVTLLPLRLQSDDAVVAFSGQVGGKQQSGQLRVENLPVETLTGLVPLPLNVTGLLNATATISGSIDNPQAVGSITLANGVINGTALQEARSNFTYANARLDFTNTLAINKTEPLYVIGSIPLAIAKTIPASKQISLDINVKNEGLALLNLLTNQIAWVDGKGEVKAQVRGTLENPVITGSAKVENATLQARALPDPLTNVTGVARFDSDRIRVEQLSGSFSRGKVSATGVIPLSNRLTEGDPDQQNPLTVALNQIRLNLKGLYQGGVDGTVAVTGTAFNPVLGGDIKLSNGQVLIPDQTKEVTAQANGDGSESSVVEFADLQITLGDGVVITSQPIISFVAVGNLTINGNLNELRPDGTIRLRSGQVNLFTTQFTLERGYPQTAVFTPDRKLDPELNIRLVSLVPEVTSRRQPSVLSQSEILDVPAPATSYGSLQTVRVRAEVNGPASRLSENLRLSSSPPRSEEEIVALIGGGFVDTLGRGDTLLGVANLAGSALLSNIQGFIGNALGLSEFRLFPTTTRDDDESRESGDTGTLGLAAEAAVDITPALSVSVVKILTNNQPPQFGLRYRINDFLLLRSSTDFSGDTRAVIEYEARF